MSLCSSGLRLLQALQAGEARAGGRKDYPRRSSMQAIVEKLKAIMTGKYDKT